MKLGLALMRTLVIVGVLAAANTPRPSLAADANIDFSLTINQTENAGDEATIFTPRFGAEIPTSRSLFVNLRWGLTTVTLRSPSETGTGTVRENEVVLLNPQVGLKYQVEIRNQVRFSVGGNIAFPVADAETDATAAAYQFALSGVGGWDPWLYQPNTFGIVTPIKVEFKINKVRLGLDGAYFLLIPTDDSSDRNTQFGAQAAVGAQAEIDMFDLGMRVQAVQVGDSGVTDGYLQTSLVPFVNLFLFDEQLKIGFQFNFNFGDPTSTAFGDSGPWGLTIGAQVNL